jgi:hypothetical protein
MPILPFPRLRRVLGAAALSCALAGCAVGPDHVAPAAPVPVRLTRDALDLPMRPGAGAPDRWRVFGSAELDALVAEALVRSPTVDAAHATLRAAQENMVAQRGRFYPQVQAGLDATRQNVGRSRSSPLDSGDAGFSYRTAQVNARRGPGAAPPGRPDATDVAAGRGFRGGGAATGRARRRARVARRQCRHRRGRSHVPAASVDHRRVRRRRYRLRSDVLGRQRGLVGGLGPADADLRRRHAGGAPAHRRGAVRRRRGGVSRRRADRLPGKRPV